MEMVVKVEIPYKLGEKRVGPRYREGKIIKEYKNFVLVQHKKYRECYRREEIIKEEKEERDGNVFQDR